MNWFQWLTLLTMACLFVYAVVKFLGRGSNKVCPMCERKRPQVPVNWKNTAMDSATVEREQDSESDLSDDEPQAAAPAVAEHNEKAHNESV